MSNVTILPRAGNLAPTEDPKMLALIKRTVAADTNDDEFNIFINMARSLRLDPLRRQIYAMVFNKNDAKKRRMSLIVGIDGFRTIADRTGNYRPDEDEPTIEFDATIKDSGNPLGIVKATVRVFKFSHGEWHKVTASAYWDEYAPIKEEWSEVETYDNGEKWPDGNTKWKTRPKPGAVKIRTLDTSGQWGKMGRVMIAKCAEALSLRKAWPDDFSNVYSEEETDRARMIDVTPIEAIQQHEIAERQAKIGGPAITIDWMDGNALDAVPVGQFAERAIDWIGKADPVETAAWADRNRHSLREFWAANKTDANEIKKRLEAARGKADVLTGEVLNAG